VLILARSKNQIVRLGPDITVEVLEIDGAKVRLGLTAPPSVLILRQELVGRDGLGDGYAAKAEGQRP
jgi:carbon storage regulator